jgi:hypothetical protein
MEPPGGESGNTEHAWGMYNKPAGCSTPAFGAPHNNNNNNNMLSAMVEYEGTEVSFTYAKLI